MEENKVGRDRIVAFLNNLDGLVTRSHELHIIGGSAITLLYSAENRTADIDAVELDDELEALGGPNSDLAEKHGVHLQLLHNITFSAPKDWKEHCRKVVDPKLTNLSVYAADPNDIALGKLARLDPGDLDDIFSLKDRGEIDATSMLHRLNQNIHEVESSPGYRNNSILLFDIVFDSNLQFIDGSAHLNP